MNSKNPISLSKLLIIGLLMLIVVLQPAPALGQSDNRTPPPLDVILLVDESETMWNKTDTEDVRVNTVNYFIDLLGSEQSGVKHRVAIVAFGTEPRVISFTALDSQEAINALKAEFDTIHSQIEQRKNLEYTDINLALQASLNLLKADTDSSRKPALIFISDGQPTNRDVNEDKGEETVQTYLEETRSLLGELNQYPYEGKVCPSPNGAPLYFVGMGIDKLAESSSPAYIDLYREFWQGSSGATRGYYREAERLQEMQGISTYIFSELLCTPATPSAGIRGSQELEYQIYDNYYQIFFTVSGKDNPDLVTKIYRPSEDGSDEGVLLNRDDKGITWQGGPDYEVWGVSYSQPWSGTWRIALEGEGRAEFSYLFFPNLGITLTEPNSSFLPIDKPFAVQAKITDEVGQVVDIPLKNFWVEVAGQGVREQLKLEKEGDVYTAQQNPLPEIGEYSLTFNAVLPDGTPLSDHKYVTMISAPWVELTNPTKNSEATPTEAIELEANVHPEGAISFDDIKLIATLFEDGQPVQSIELNQNESQPQNNDEIVAYAGAFQPVDSAGTYTVQTKLRAILPGGRIFDHETAPLLLSVQTPPTASPTTTPSPSPSPTDTSTSTPTLTATPEPAVVVVPTITPSPTPVPSPTPTPLPWYSAVAANPSFWPCFWGLLILLLLLIPLAFWWYKHRQAVPAQIELLADLMKARQEKGEPPYVLVIGSGEAVVLGNKSMKPIVETIAGGQDLANYYNTLDGFSPTERQMILHRHFDEAKISVGYRRLAELAERRYFDLIFTTNVDPFLETLLAGDGQQTTEFQVIIAEKQKSDTTVQLLNSNFPPIKIVKLHGDVHARSFAFTPSEISHFGNQSEEVLSHYLNRDLIIIGPGQRDYDLNRAISRDGGSIWYIDQEPPVSDTPMSQVVVKRSTEMNIITGEYGQFDRFFEALYRALMRS